MPNEIIKLVPAAPIINAVCKRLNYSRSHVANLLRVHAKVFGAVKRGKRWKMLPTRAEEQLAGVVKRASGRRYKLGETGTHNEK